MFLRVLRFVRLPLLMLLLYALGRFWIGVKGVPYAPRGNAIFSVVGLTIISSIYFGALSRKVGGFGWLGTILVGFVVGLWAQLLVFALTLISYSAHLTTSYYLNWDSLNLKEGAPPATMNQLLAIRAGGLVTNVIIAIVAALIGRLLGVLVSAPARDVGAG
ncbi:MAG: hypothetical protein DMF64_11830 [Acidobacteria bacterium]|nr:MAG: hypothetical protein DMF64_11830 [Acidobacteriota bacterium]